jgi:soluble lytic murein transglycosylase
LGQRYVRYLLDMERIDGNMLYLAAAYNAGPGNLSRWQKKIDYKGDPLLFIESIPLSETRAYVERVMTNYWIYNQRLGQEDKTLRQLSRDVWPVYTARGNFKLAAN